MNKSNDAAMEVAKQITEVATSLRKWQSELAYQKAKADKKTIPLELAPVIKRFNLWRIIPNDYPYDAVFKVHHMLVPSRGGVSERRDLNISERQEFEQILELVVYPEYDVWFENCPKRRSVSTLYHVHLAVYHDSRAQMQLP